MITFIYIALMKNHKPNSASMITFIYIALMKNHKPNSASMITFDTEISNSPMND